MSRQLAAQSLAAAAPAPAAAKGNLLQRKCDCGAHTPGGGACGSCASKDGALQRKLVIGASNDPFEHEADRIADAVLAPRAGFAPPAWSRPRIQRMSAAGGGGRSAPQSVEAALREPGSPLAGPVRQDMEQRFGHDFSAVRLHRGGAAERSARDVQARAYTVGRNIVFGAGQPGPSSPEGARLLAHELVHVIQQGAAGPVAVQPSMLQRQEEPGILGDLEKELKDLAKSAENEVREQLRAVGALPGPKALFSKSGCPKNFCSPFSDVSLAKQNLYLTAPFLLAGVAKVVSPRVVPLWKDYLFGGSAPQNLTASFGKDFTASARTLATTNFIVSQLKLEIKANHKAIMPGPGPAAVDLTPRMSKTLAAIDDQNNGNAMDFNTIGEIPGNIAGGIGKDQLTNKIGAMPSPFNDARSASISATLTRTAKGIKVKPSIAFTVLDTIDLCPGNCGAVTEQDATIVMSRFEATGLSGDVPFRVDFPAPATALGEFEIPVAGSSAPKKPKGPAKGPAKPGKGKKKGAKAKSGKTAMSDGEATSGALASENEAGDGDEEAVAANDNVPDEEMAEA